MFFFLKKLQCEKYDCVAYFETPLYSLNQRSYTCGKDNVIYRVLIKHNN